jgi:hypothetical protein
MGREYVFALMIVKKVSFFFSKDKKSAVSIPENSTY